MAGVEKPRRTARKTSARTRPPKRTRSQLQILSASDIGRHGLDREALADVVDRARWVDLDAGEVLFEAGDPATEVFFISKGSVSVTIDVGGAPIELAKVGRGAVLGEIGVLEAERRSAGATAVRATELVALPAPTFRDLLATDPRVAELVAVEATARLRRTQLLRQLATLLGTTDPGILAGAAETFSWVTLRAGEALFSAGDSGDAAYLVAAGRLELSLRHPDGSEESRPLRPGDIVGELSLLDGQPRGGSVYALRDSSLVELTRAGFEQLVDAHPQIGLAVARKVVEVRRRGVADDLRARTTLLVGISEGLDVAALTALASSVVSFIGGRRVTVFSSAEIDRRLAQEGVSQLPDGEFGSGRVRHALEEAEASSDHIVLVADRTWSEWSRRALRSADSIMVVADANDDPAPKPFERQLWGLIGEHHHPPTSLVLIHPSATRMPIGTAAWLRSRAVDAHHHVRRDDRAHLARLGRAIVGTSVALVLSGGGARGFAHLGVIEVLGELGVSVDVLGGTSIGAIMAAPKALEWSDRKARETARTQFSKLLDYTPPLVALLRGQRITRSLREQFGEIDLCDMWLPYFCVSADLTSADIAVHDQGDLVTAIRASIAIPGVLPPVAIGDHLHVDGGLLDNLPVTEMRRRNPDGPLIAVDVSPESGPRAAGDFGLAISGFRAWRLRRHGAGPPSLLSTMVRASLLGSEATRRQARIDGVADLEIDLQIEGGGLLDFSAADTIADDAARLVRPELTEWVQGSVPGGPADASNDADAPDSRGGAMTATTHQRAPVVIKKTAPAATPPPAIVPTRHRFSAVLLLSLRDLQYRAVRLAVVVFGIGVVLTLLFVMTGLVEQFHREPRDTVSAFGAPLWLVEEGASGAFTSAATVSLDAVATVEGTEAAPLVVARHTLDAGSGTVDIVVVGFAAGGLGEPALRDGRLPAAPNEAVLDSSGDVAIGDRVVVGSTPLDVVGRTSGRTMFAGMPLLHVDLATAQQLVYGGQPRATAALLAGEPTAVPPGLATLEADTVADDALRPLERSIASVNLVRVLLWLVAALIIATMTYLSAIERRRDVAVLKAVGGATVDLGVSIALQGVITALAASAVASILQIAVVPIFPLDVAVPSSAFFQIPVIAVVVALAAGWFGLRQAVKVDPALAFQGPST